MKILLTHSPQARELYYGPRALAGLRQLGAVSLHEGNEPLEGESLIKAAQDCDLIVSYRQSPGPAVRASHLRQTNIKKRTFLARRFENRRRHLSLFNQSVQLGDGAFG